MKKFVLLFGVLGIFGIAANFAAADDSAPTFSLPNSADFSFFGTAGYAASDKDFKYNKISKSGTFDLDSRIGAQLDWQITPRLGLILQGELSQSLSDDHRWRPRMPWALLRFQATDNWVLKVGRSRLPALLFSQNGNVGKSYVAARLPVEIYGLAPTFEYNGIASTYYWDVGDDGMKSIAWDFYGGMSNFWQRVWFRTNPTTMQESPTHYARRLNVVGSFLTYEDAMENNIIRTGFHLVTVKNRDGTAFLKRNEVVTFPTGFRLFMPNAGETTEKVKFLLFGILGDWHLGNGFYGTGEFGIRRAMNMLSGMETRAFYVQLRKSIAHFTPYVSWGYSKTGTKSRNAYDAMSQVSGIPQFALYDAMNRISADAMLMANQYTIALGTAYDIGNHHRLKVEYAHTRIGKGSYLLDQPVAMPSVENTDINVFSASYNFLF